MERLRWGTASELFEVLLKEETDDCVLWPYAKDYRGYGQARMEGRTKYTHRAACIRRLGDPPFAGAEAAHSCRNRNCMNYRHLRWATRAENCGDTIKDGSSTRGSKNPMSKLTEADVLEIRRRVAEGEQARPIAESFGIKRQTVYHITAGRLWGWLT